MARGIERRRIFRSDGDRRRFIDRLGRVVRDASAVVYAWSLLPNHVHIVLRSGPGGLSSLMQRLLTGYAVTFNRRHGRCGHLFQNRFKSTLVDESAYLLELIRYVHLNPVRAGLLAGLDELDGYPWTGHAALVGSSPSPPWQGVAMVLEHFDPDAERARVTYRRFLADGLTGALPDFSGNGFLRDAGRWSLVPALRRGREAWAFAERVLGRPAFIGAVASSLPPLSAPPPRRVEADRVDVARLVADVATCLNLRPEHIMRSGRCRPMVIARACLAHVLVRQYGFSLTRAAQVLGSTKWSVGRGLQRSEVLASDPMTPLSEQLQILNDRPQRHRKRSE
jgi:putative transposase